MHALRRLLIAATLLALPLSAHAGPITYTFHSDLLQSVPDGPAAGSTHADLVLVLDSEAPDQHPDPDQGRYAVETARAEFSNGYVSTASNTGTLSVSTSGMLWDGGSGGISSNFGIQDDIGGSSALPTTPGTWNVTPLAVSYFVTDDYDLMQALPLTLAIVPEPGTFALVVLGLVAAAFRRR